MFGGKRGREGGAASCIYWNVTHNTLNLSIEQPYRYVISRFGYQQSNDIASFGFLQAFCFFNRLDPILAQVDRQQAPYDGLAFFGNRT